MASTVRSIFFKIITKDTPPLTGAAKYGCLLCVLTLICIPPHSLQLCMQNYVTLGRVITLPDCTSFLCRLYWLLSISAGFGLLAAVMTDRLFLYYSYPKRVNVQFTYTKKMEFPVVTICNQNLFRYELLNTYRPLLQSSRWIYLACSCLPKGWFQH